MQNPATSHGAAPPPYFYWHTSSPNAAKNQVIKLLLLENSKHQKESRLIEDFKRIRKEISMNVYDKRKGLRRMKHFF